jgi:hypothetical protein
LARWLDDRRRFGLLLPNLIAGIDFNYYNFEFNRSATNTDGTISTWYNTNSNVYAVTARLDYLFNWSK